MFWYMLTIIILLTWIGVRAVEFPNINIGMLLTIMYFMYFMMDPVIKNIWDKIIN